MAIGRQKVEWNHTAALMAMQAELSRDRKKRKEPFTPADFHPWGAEARRVKAKKDMLPLSAMRRFFKG